MGILEDILARLERIESAVSADRKTNPTEPAPQQWSGPPTTTTTPAVAAPPPGGSLYGGVPGGTAVPATPGPAAVPTLDELNALLLDLQQQHGTDLCVSLMRQHQGEDQEGNVSLSNVPAEQYAALQQAIRQQMGVH